jgi:hypothetical protein
MDYLLAVLVGGIGMLGLLELTADIVSLNTEAYEMTLALFILDDMAVLSRLQVAEGVPLSQWCAVLPEAVRDSHCRGLSDWLGRLAQSELRIASDNRIALAWLSSSGERMELALPL